MDQPLDERDAARASDRACDTQLVLAIRAGDANVRPALRPLVRPGLRPGVAHVRTPRSPRRSPRTHFLKAWRSLDSLENPDSFGGWLLRIARNAYNRSERKAARRPSTTRGSR
jgi:hypothetical protein